MQLPPVVKNSVFKQFSKFDQSLFARLVRIGVPTIVLERQGRCRPEIANLFNWRYNAAGHALGNLDNVTRDPAYQAANAGFVYTFQLVDVGPFKGRGEHCPTPHFYQNLGEAEYVVAVYQYMRLLGYPRESITILTTYNGQKSLILDVIKQRCKGSVFGSPAAVSTVDQYQGQQNDYVLLSLVRTSSVGHLRDIRRLLVALSRARLGLYVFCRQSVFENCLELSPAFSLLANTPHRKLELVMGEAFPAARRADEKPTETCTMEDVTAMGVLVYQMAQKDSAGL
jgi:intron-binding protein aquarius